MCHCTVLRNTAAINISVQYALSLRIGSTFCTNLAADWAVTHASCNGGGSDKRYWSNKIMTLYNGSISIVGLRKINRMDNGTQNLPEQEAVRSNVRWRWDDRSGKVYSVWSTQNFKTCSLFWLVLPCILVLKYEIITNLMQLNVYLSSFSSTCFGLTCPSSGAMDVTISLHMQHMVSLV